MLRINPGVKVGSIRPEVFFALRVAEGVWAKYGSDEVVLTSATEGLHVSGSMHYSFAAVDIRVKNLATLSIVAAAVAELKDRLGPDYRVFNESPGTANAHCHIEFRPTNGITSLSLPRGSKPRTVRRRPVMKGQ